MSKFVKTVIKAFEWVYETFVEPVVNFVGDLFGFDFGSFGAPEIKDPGEQAQGVTVTKQGTNVGIPIIYGHREVGGIVIFAETKGDSNRYLYVVYAIAEGDIEGVRRIYIDDEEIPNVFTGGNGCYPNANIIKITSGKFKDRLQFQIFEGTENQPQSSLANETPTWPKKQRRLPGVAYAVFRYEWYPIKNQTDADNNPYKGGIPQIRFEIFGKRIYDVRTHNATAYGKNINPSTPNYSDLLKRYSFNPANALFDYMTNPRYGVGLALNELDLEAFKIAANKCEQRVTYSDGSNREQGRAITCNAVLQTTATCFDNVRTLLAGARGIMPYINGKYKLKIEDGGHPTDITSTVFTSAYDITNDVIVGGITMSGERKENKYNQVIINYIDPDKQFSNQQVVFSRVGDLAKDNNEPLIGEFTFHTITNVSIANDIAQMIYDKSRQQRQINFTATQELLNVEVGDIIRVTDTVLDLSTTAFRVVSMRLQNDGTIQIDATEHIATFYPYTPVRYNIELPAPIFRPDNYYIRPYVRELPQGPVTIIPAYDPDYDSAGTPIIVVDENTNITDITLIPDNSQVVQPLPPLPVQDVRVTVFEDYQTPQNGYYYLNGDPNNPSQGFLPLYNTPKTSSAVFHKTGTRIQNIKARNYGLYFVEGGTLFLDLIAPADTAIDQLIIRAYKDKTIIRTTIWPLRSYPARCVYFAPVSNAVARTDEQYSQRYHPLYFAYELPGKSLSIRITWRKDAEDLEYPDGSVFPSEQGWNGVNYVNYNGDTVFDSNLEALFNDANQNNDVDTAVLENLINDSYDLGS